jgi:hypothetical protein
MLLKAEEKKQIAELLNARLDIPWVPEELEKPIFEHALGAVDATLEGVLPEAFGILLRDGGKGIDEAQARAFGERLINAINKKVNLPYFDEAQEAAFLKMIIEPLVEAMSNGQTLDDVLDRVRAEVNQRLEADQKTSE